ncbi:MAG TPA: tannase/feruloyl esterase family alpha/beta hydrolase [Caulobacteraceae bacterium]
MRLLIVVVLAWLACGAGAAAQANETANRCVGLKAFAWPHLQVEEARLVAAGPAPSPGGPTPPQDLQLPEHCLFRAVISPRTSASGPRLGVGFELRLPTAWNGRFVFEGGGGLDGVLNPAVGGMAGRVRPAALAQGFAVVTTDGGHRGASMMDARFAIDQQARIDYAYGAVDKTTWAAKAVIQAFYGREPDRSYFLGCSNGGRQALIAAERLPLEFDGIVAGDPSFRLAWTNVDEAWNEIVLARAAPKGPDGRPIISRALSDADLKLVGDAVLHECDGKDGLKDGMINDFRACRFDPAVLTCKEAKTDRCLTALQVRTLKALMGGPHDSRGQALYAAFPYDSGIAGPAFRQMHFGTSPTGVLSAADATLGFDSLRGYAMTPPDPSFDVMRFDFDRDSARVRETSKLNDADATFLTTFAHRGKLLLYHGLSDQGLSPLDTIAWYDRLASSTGGNTQDWARLYLVPGMTHCAGGSATDEFDVLAALQAWVERDEAPDRIVARGKTFPGVTRPLCPYPKVARYQGGDPASEKSFICKE